jgi:D-glycero-D-manno-heptose 1,7-bisphosphate phosphatase
MPSLPTAVLLDRDGVINQPVLDPTSGMYESPYSIDAVHLVPGADKLILKLQCAGIPVSVVSNQPAAAKETHTLHGLKAVDAEIRRQLALEGVLIENWYYCFHHPDGSHPILGSACRCRKPQPGMLEKALHDLDALPGTDIWMVGDSDVDIEAGAALGLTTVLFEHPKTTHRRRGATRPTWRAESTDGVSRLIFRDAP